MFFICLLSYGAGYYLNEEKSLSRLCRNLNYAHEGWLVLHHEKGYYLYIFFYLLSFIKSWGWGAILKNTVFFWGFPAGAYLLGNITAIAELKRTSFSFTFWCSWVGILLAVDKVLFQIPLTAAMVCYLVTREKILTLKVWKMTLCVVVLIFLFSQHRIYGLVMLVVAYMFWRKQSPLRTKLIQ